MLEQIFTITISADNKKHKPFINIKFQKHLTQIENSWWNDFTLDDLQKQWNLAYERFNMHKLSTCFITAYSYEHELLEMWVLYPKKSSIVIQHRCITNPEEFHIITKDQIITVSNSFILIPEYSQFNFKGFILPEWKIPFNIDTKGNQS